jgi:hypothetical protein
METTGDTTPMPTGTPSSTATATTSSSIGSLTITDSTPRIGYFGSTEQTYFPVELAVANGDDQQTSVQNYEYDVVACDADGNNVNGNREGSSGGEDTVPDRAARGRSSPTAYNGRPERSRPVRGDAVMFPLLSLPRKLTV